MGDVLFKQLETTAQGESVALSEVLAALQFSDDGLIPAIAQQHDTGEVVMVGYMNRATLEETLTTGRVCYYSRSRDRIWRKGEESGNIQLLKDLRIDCDGDAVLLRVDQHGPACHTGRRRCFYLKVDGDRVIVTDALERRPEDMYRSTDLSTDLSTNSRPMDIKLYNTLTGRKELFVPLDPNCVTMYVCGPTVYNLVHIGNGRPAVVFDVLYRLLSAKYPKVRYAANVTDIDDKINKAAIDGNESIAELAERFTIAYNEDVRALGNLPPTLEPRATHHVAEIVAMIERLIERGHAYAADGHVLFHVPSDPDYGMLSHRSLEDMLDGARVEVAPYKRDPKDFVLWKPSTPELPGWDSPWSRGRPGWHIECSAMIRKHLGSTIDIHGGGSDLTFPHHENELAQGRCVDDGATYVRYWMHNGMLTLGDEKMSKSVGNIITLRDLLARNGGEVLRYALLSGNYRSQLAWSDDLLKQAQASLDRIYQAMLDIPPGNAVHPDQFKHAPLEAFPPAVVEALADDLNTTGALAAMHGIVSDMHRANDPAKSRVLRDQLIAGAWLMGLLTDDPEAHFKSRATVDPAYIDERIAARIAARAARDFKLADAIRDELLARGIKLKDTPTGTDWSASWSAAASRSTEERD